MTLAEVVTLGELKALESAVRDYTAQAAEIEKKGGMPGYSGRVARQLSALYAKIVEEPR